MNLFGKKKTNEGPTILHPYIVRYKLLRILSAEGIINEPHCLAAVVDRVSSEYEKDWERCVATCRDLEIDTDRFIRHVAR